MVATAINSVTIVFWKETAFPLCRATIIIIIVIIIIITSYAVYILITFPLDAVVVKQWNLGPFCATVYNGIINDTVYSVMMPKGKTLE